MGDELTLHCGTVTRQQEFSLMGYDTTEYHLGHRSEIFQSDEQKNKISLDVTLNKPLLIDPSFAYAFKYFAKGLQDLQLSTCSSKVQPLLPTVIDLGPLDKKIEFALLGILEKFQPRQKSAKPNHIWIYAPAVQTNLQYARLVGHLTQIIKQYTPKSETLKKASETLQKIADTIPQCFSDYHHKVPKATSVITDADETKTATDTGRKKKRVPEDPHNKKLVRCGKRYKKDRKKEEFVRYELAGLFYQRAAGLGSEKGKSEWEKLARSIYKTAYHMGRNVPHRERADLHALAARLGHREAAFQAGKLYYFKEFGIMDYDKAFNYFRMAANQGHIEAAGHFGWELANGKGFKRDLAAAKKYLLMAHNKDWKTGDSTYNSVMFRGQFSWRLGKIYLEQKKYAEALGALTKAVEKDYLKAAIDLYKFYRQGREGIAKNVKKSQEWLIEARKLAVKLVDLARSDLKKRQEKLVSAQEAFKKAQQQLTDLVENNARSRQIERARKYATNMKIALEKAQLDVASDERDLRQANEEETRVMAFVVIVK